MHDRKNADEDVVADLEGRQEAALAALREADAGIRAAWVAYDVALRRCTSLKIRKSRIASSIGKSEAAVRQYLKRNHDA